MHRFAIPSASFPDLTVSTPELKNQWMATNVLLDF
jgi:hypothetical protein